MRNLKQYKRLILLRPHKCWVSNNLYLVERRLDIFFIRYVRYDEDNKAGIKWRTYNLKNNDYSKSQILHEFQGFNIVAQYDNLEQFTTDYFEDFL